MTKIECAIIILLIIIIAVLASLLIIKENRFAKIKETYLGNLLNDNSSLNGNYWEGIACIKLKGRSYSNFIKTCNHEYFHYEDDGHFNWEG